MPRRTTSFINIFWIKTLCLTLRISIKNAGIVSIFTKKVKYFLEVGIIQCLYFFSFYYFSESLAT